MRCSKLHSAAATYVTTRNTTLPSPRTCQVSPKYAQTFVPGVLVVARSSESALRASSLAILAQLCLVLRHALHAYVEDIMACVRGLIVDREDEVRTCGMYQ